MSVAGRARVVRCFSVWDTMFSGEIPLILAQQC